MYRKLKIVLQFPNCYGLKKCWQNTSFLYQLNKSANHNFKAGTSCFAAITLVKKVIP
jgi:hypothetical protein